MMIKLKNTGAETLNFTTLSIEGNQLAAGEAKTVYNNNQGGGMSQNTIEELQTSSELMVYINAGNAVFIVNGVEKDTPQSIAIMQPNINL